MIYVFYENLFDNVSRYIEFLTNHSPKSPVWEMGDGISTISFQWFLSINLM